MLNPESTGNDYGAASCSTDQENIDLEAPVGVTPEQRYGKLAPLSIRGL